MILEIETLTVWFFIIFLQIILAWTWTGFTRHVYQSMKNTEVDSKHIWVHKQDVTQDSKQNYYNRFPSESSFGKQGYLLRYRSKSSHFSWVWKIKTHPVCLRFFFQNFLNSKDWSFFEFVGPVKLEKLTASPSQSQISHKLKPELIRTQNHMDSKEVTNLCRRQHLGHI